MYGVFLITEIQIIPIYFIHKVGNTVIVYVKHYCLESVKTCTGNFIVNELYFLIQCDVYRRSQNERERLLVFKLVHSKVNSFTYSSDKEKTFLNVRF